MAENQEPKAPRLIPSTRFTLALLVSFAVFVQYSQRVSLSMAIVCMVNRTNINIASKTTLYPDQMDNKSLIVSPKFKYQLLEEKQFFWSELQQQILLGAYWFGYIFTLVPSGWLSIKWGAKNMFAVSLLSSSIATIGICVIYYLNHFNYYLALLFRIVIGFTHGPLFPATYTFWSMWAVPLERSTLTSIGFCSNNLGTSVTMLIGGVLCRYLNSGWVYIFLLTSIFGFIWLPLWLWLVADSPQTHRTISEKERNYICEKIGTNSEDKKKKIIPLASLPWKNIVRSKPIIGLFITECCNLFGLFFFYTNVGKILTEIHRVPTQYAGYVLAGGFILMPISSLLSGVIADRLCRADKMSLTNVRKLFNTLASFIPTVCMIVLCFCDESQQILGIVTILVFLAASAMAYGSGYIVNFVDVMPAFSSIIFGITTAAATLCALLGNVLAGLIIKKPILSDWRRLFIIFAVIYFIGGVAFLVLGSAEPRKWATFEAQEKRQNEGGKKKVEEEAVPLQPLAEGAPLQPSEEIQEVKT